MLKLLENKDYLEDGHLKRSIGYIIFICGMLLSIVGCSNITKPVVAQWTLEQSIGVAMPELNYASKDTLIFHGYFGLFIYDLNTKSITHSLDLESIGCHFMQGSAYCEVSVSQDGSIIQLHPMDNDKMYIYNVEKNKLTQMNYGFMEDPFKVIINDNPNGSVSYETVKFENGDIGYLKSEDSTLNGLYYVVGNNKYKLFK